MPHQFTDFLKDFQYLNIIDFQKEFLFEINLPNFIAASSEISGKRFQIDNKITAYCITNTLTPGINIQVENISYFNSVLKYPSQVTYTDWHLNFRLNINIASGTLTNIPKIPNILKNTLLQNNNILKNLPVSPISLYEYFYNWIELMYDHKTRLSHFPEQFKRDILLYLLDDNYEKKMLYTLYSCFPSSLETANLNYEGENYAIFGVNLAFDKFTFQKIT